MRVALRQSGGFAGLVQSCRLDAAAVPALAWQRLTAMVDAAGLEQSCECLSETCRDGLIYELEIERDSSRVLAVFDEVTLPAAARLLVAFLQERLQPGDVVEE